jgi:hypothetical protein
VNGAELYKCSRCGKRQSGGDHEPGSTTCRACAASKPVGTAAQLLYREQRESGASPRRAESLDEPERIERRELGEDELRALLLAIAYLVRELRERGRSVPPALVTVDRVLREAFETGTTCRILTQASEAGTIVESVDTTYVSLNVFAGALAVSRRTVERMLRDEQIDSKKVRGRRLIPVSELERIAKP